MSDANPPSPRDSAGVLQTLITIRMVRLFALLRRGGILAQRRHFDLSEIEWRIVTQLGDERAPLSLNGLAEALAQDRGQLSRAVKAMVERGFVSRERKPGGPEIEIKLSATGWAMHAEMVKWVIERDERLTADVDPADLEVLWRVSDTMVENARTMLEEEQRASG